MVEHRTLNPLVVGSSPTALTSFRSLAVVAALVACNRSAEQHPPTGSAGTSSSPDAAVAATALPACKQRVTFDELPPAPINGAGKLDGNELLVGQLAGSRYSLASYDVGARKWHVLPGVELGAKEEHTPFSHFLTKQSLLLATEVKGDHRVVRRFDRASKRWSAAASTPTSPSDYLTWTIDDMLVLLPYKCIRQPERTLVLKGNRFESVPTTFALHSSPDIQVVGGKLVVWGGPAGARTSPKPSCKVDDAHAIDGVVLDPATAKWTPMTSGPPALEHISGFAAGGYMFVYGRAGARVVLWRYDVAKRVWKEIGELPHSFADQNILTMNDVAHLGSTVVVNHPGSAPAQVVIDVEAGTLRTSQALPVAPAAFVAIDKTHVLLLPHPAMPAPVAYIEDVETLAWCELPWIDRAPFYQRDKPTFVAIAKSVGDKLLVWLDGHSAGYLATFR